MNTEKIAHCLSELEGVAERIERLSTMSAPMLAMRLKAIIIELKGATSIEAPKDSTNPATTPAGQPVY